MRICLVSREYPPELPGGIATQTALKARGLAARGHEVHVITSGDGDSEPVGPTAGATCTASPSRSSGSTVTRTGTSRSSGASTSRRSCTRSTAEVGFEIVQFPEYLGEGLVYQTDSGTIGPPVRRPDARPAVDVRAPHGLAGARLDAARDRGFMEAAVLRRADVLLASSHATADFCAERVRGAARSSAGDPLGCRHRRVRAARAPARRRRSARALRRQHRRQQGRAPGRFARYARCPTAIPASCCGSRASGDLGASGRSGRPALPRCSATSPTPSCREHYAWCDVFAGPSTYEPGPRQRLPRGDGRRAAHCRGADGRCARGRRPTAGRACDRPA